MILSEILDAIKNAGLDIEKIKYADCTDKRLQHEWEEYVKGLESSNVEKHSEDYSAKIVFEDGILSKQEGQDWKYEPKKGLRRSKGKNPFMFGQRVIVQRRDGQEIGIVVRGSQDATNGDGSGGVWVHSFTIDCSERYPVDKVKPLPNGQL